jgi:hypothetical protein
VEKSVTVHGKCYAISDGDRAGDPYNYVVVVVYHMQSQFIAKYENSHFVTRKYKTCHNLSRKITVLAIFRSRRNVCRNS